jgi:hypothetical protein
MPPLSFRYVLLLAVFAEFVRTEALEDCNVDDGMMDGCPISGSSLLQRPHGTFAQTSEVAGSTLGESDRASEELEVSANLDDVDLGELLAAEDSGDSTAVPVAETRKVKSSAQSAKAPPKTERALEMVNAVLNEILASPGNESEIDTILPDEQPVEETMHTGEDSASTSIRQLKTNGKRQRFKALAEVQNSAVEHQLQNSKAAQDLKRGLEVWDPARDAIVVAPSDATMFDKMDAGTTQQLHHGNLVHDFVVKHGLRKSIAPLGHSMEEEGGDNDTAGKYNHLNQQQKSAKSNKEQASQDSLRSFANEVLDAALDSIIVTAESAKSGLHDKTNHMHKSNLQQRTLGQTLAGAQEVHKKMPSQDKGNQVKRKSATRDDSIIGKLQHTRGAVATHGSKTKQQAPKDSKRSVDNEVAPPTQSEDAMIKQESVEAKDVAGGRNLVQDDVVETENQRTSHPHLKGLPRK